MHFISKLSRFAITVALATASVLSFGQQPTKINAHSQINWTKITGTGAPSATCSSIYYGLPYVDLATNNHYTCTSSGWVLNSGGGGGSVEVNGSVVSSPNFNGTTPAAPSGSSDVGWQFDGSGNVSAYVPSGTILPGATVVLSGDSRLQDDAHVLGATITATASSCATGGLCTITAPNTYVAGQWVSLYGGFSGCWGDGPNYYGTGTYLFQVLPSGLSSSQFQVQTTCSAGSYGGGGVEDASYFVPVAAMKLPAFNGAGTWYLRNGVDATSAYGGNTGLACEQNANYTAMFHTISPAVTGRAGYIIDQSGFNDLGLGNLIGLNSTSILTCMKSFWAKAHTDGWIVYKATVMGGSWGIWAPADADTQLATINATILASGKSTSNAASGQYVDGHINAMEFFGGDQFTSTGYWSGHTFSATGASLFSKLIAGAVQASGSGISHFQCDSYMNCGALNATNAWTGANTWSGTETHTGADTFTHLRLNGQAQSTAVICPNGTSGDLTTSGCVPGDANGLSSPTYATGGGAAQAQTITLSPAISTLSTGGLWVRWKPVASNTTADPTLAVNGLTAITIKKCGTTSLVAGDLNNTAIALAVYDGTNFQLINPQSAACGGGGGGGVTTLFGSSNPTGVNTPVIVQRASNNAVFGNPAVTFSGSVTIGNTVIVSISSGSCVNSPGTITDTRGTTFSLILNAACSYVYAGTLTSTGADTITSSAFSGGGQPGASEFAVEVTNLTTTLDSSATSGSGNPIAESYTSTAAQDLIMSVWQDTNGGFSGTSSTSGWTLTGYRGGNSNGQNQATQIGTAIGTYSITWTGSGSGSAAIFGIKAAASPVSGTEGQLYFQTSSNPYVCWIYHSSTWTMCGALSITATAPLRVNTVSGSAQTGTTFSVDCPTCAGSGSVLVVTDSTSRTMASNAFTKQSFDTVVTDTASGWSAVNNQYTIPTTGTYIINTKLRVIDGATSNQSYGQGVSNDLLDHPWFQWFISSGASPTARNGSLNSRIAHFAAGTVLQMYYYGPGLGTVSAEMDIVYLNSN